MSGSDAAATRRSSRPQRKRMFIDTYESLGRDEEKQLSAALKASLAEEGEEGEEEASEKESEKEEAPTPPPIKRGRGRPRGKASKNGEGKAEVPVKSEQQNENETDTKNPKAKRKKSIIRQKSVSGDKDSLTVKPQRKFASVTSNGRKHPTKRKPTPRCAPTPRRAPSLPSREREDSEDAPKTEEFVDYLCLRNAVPAKLDSRQLSGDDDSLVIAESEESAAEDEI